MASKLKPKTEIETLALQILRSLYVATEGQPMQWRMLSGIEGAIEEAVLYAVEQGWLDLEGNHSVRLTDQGRDWWSRVPTRGALGTGVRREDGSSPLGPLRSFGRIWRCWQGPTSSPQRY
jgi:hypothetical protein